MEAEEVDNGGGGGSSRVEVPGVPLDGLIRRLAGMYLAAMSFLFSAEFDGVFTVWYI